MKSNPNIGLGKPPQRHNRTASKDVPRKPSNSKEVKVDLAPPAPKSTRVVSAGFAAPTISSSRHVADKGDARRITSAKARPMSSSQSSARPQSSAQHEPFNTSVASEARRPALRDEFVDVDEFVHPQGVRHVEPADQALSPLPTETRPANPPEPETVQPHLPPTETSRVRVPKNLPVDNFASSQESISGPSSNSKRASLESPVRERPLQTKRSRVQSKGKQVDRSVPFPPARPGSSLANAINVDEDHEEDVFSRNTATRRARIVASASQRRVPSETQAPTRTRGVKRASVEFDDEASRKRAKTSVQDPRRVVSHAFVSKRPPRGPTHRPNAKPFDGAVPGEASRLRALEREKRIHERQERLEKELAEKERRQALVRYRLPLNI